MIIPIRCFSCGKPVSHVWEEFKEKYDSKKGHCLKINYPLGIKVLKQIKNRNIFDF